MCGQSSGMWEQTLSKACLSKKPIKRGPCHYDVPQETKSLVLISRKESTETVLFVDPYYEACVYEYGVTEENK